MAGVGIYLSALRIDRPTLRLQDLRHTCAFLWLSAAADPKVSQRTWGMLRRR